MRSMKKSELQNITNEFFSKLGNNIAIVPIEITIDPKIMAGARGLKLFNVPIGQIFINKSLLSGLSKGELEFVLAHEIVHIDQNHLPINILHKLPKEMIDELGKNDSIAKGFSIAWDLIKLWIHLQGDLPPDAAITKQQELQADTWAIWLTGNKTAAIACLKKLVNNNLNAYSHTWEAFDVKLPIMTMRERIADILATIEQYERQGYIFM